MAKRYNVVSNVATDTDDELAEARDCLLRIDRATGYSPGVEEKICPSRFPSAELAASLTPDSEFEEAEQLDKALAEAIAILDEED